MICFSLGALAAWWMLQRSARTWQDTKKSLESQLAKAQGELEESVKKRLEAVEKAARCEAESHQWKERWQTQKEELSSGQAAMLAQFNSLASEVLDQKSRKFAEHNKDQIQQILSPLAERIGRFEQQVTAANQDNLTQSVALRTEIQKLAELNTRITQEAENLTKAIKGDTKVQGNWGEFILESILEKSGLVKDREYVVQASFTTGEGKRYQPDVIVNLPEGRHIIIDSKVSLVNYERFFSLEDEEDRTLALKRHVQSMRKHIKDLGEKNYQGHYHLDSLDFILMFVPIEPAFSLAAQHDLSLFNEAYEKNIVLVSPSTLIATLRTIANIWKQERQNQNALEIAERSGALYDKFVGLVEDLTQLGRQMDTAQKSYTEAMRKLSQGKGNLVRRTEHIKALGAKASKSLEQKLIDRAQT